MSRPVNPTCAAVGCGNHKGVENHWWTIIAAKGPAPGITIYPGTAMGEEAQGWTYFDCCGQSCALKVVSEQMGKQAQV